MRGRVFAFDVEIIAFPKDSSAIIERNADDQGYKKLKDIPVVAPLLELARSEYPKIFRDWTVVSYHRPSDKDPGANIAEINSKS